jgi:protein phosphatase
LHGRQRIVNITIPNPSLVVLVGPSGSGKSTFAARHFRPTEVVSSDRARALVSDDENDQAATPAAFRIVHAVVRERLRARRLSVVDATNVKPQSRAPLIALARKRGLPAIAIVFDLTEAVCVERNQGRTERSLTADVIHRQRDEMERSMSGLEAEGFQRVYRLDSPEAVASAVLHRVP